MTLESTLRELLQEDPAVMNPERDGYTFCVEVALRRALWKQPGLAPGAGLEQAVRRELERIRLTSNLPDYARS